MRGPCQRVARNCATRSLTPPCCQPVDSGSLTWAVVWAREVPRGLVNHRRVDGMQEVRGQIPSAPPPGHRPSPPSATPGSPASGSRSAAICSERPIQRPVRRCRRPAWLTASPGRPGHTGPRPAAQYGKVDRSLSYLPRMAPATCASDVPLETATNRSAPMACGPTVDQARPLAGQWRSAWRTLPRQGRPPPAAPTGEPHLGDRLGRGALAGSGPGTSPCVDGLSLVSGMVVPQPPAGSNHAHDGGWLGLQDRSRLMRATRPLRINPA
jgi:hypothetical protein